MTEQEIAEFRTIADTADLRGRSPCPLCAGLALENRDLRAEMDRLYLERGQAGRLRWAEAKLAQSEDMRDLWRGEAQRVRAVVDRATELLEGGNLAGALEVLKGAKP